MLNNIIATFLLSTIGKLAPNMEKLVALKPQIKAWFHEAVAIGVECNDTDLDDKYFAPRANDFIDAYIDKFLVTGAEPMPMGATEEGNEELVAIAKKEGVSSILVMAILSTLGGEGLRILLKKWFPNLLI